MRYRLREVIARWETEHRLRLSFESLGQQTGISPQVLSKMSDPAREYATSSHHLELLAVYFDVEVGHLIVIDREAVERELRDAAQGRPAKEESETDTG